MATTDDAARARLSVAAEIARLEALLARMLEVEARTKRPHPLPCLPAPNKGGRMTYILDKTWANLASDATAVSTNLRESLMHGKESYEEWIHFAAGRSDADIAAALGVPVVQVQHLAAVHQAALELYNFATNVPAPVAGDRFFGLRKFS